ncbi:hypothetical protein ACFOOM_27145 [Streptomyces echinoruber]|nr:hypothetical protein [Streptomyces echinoruber]
MPSSRRNSAPGTGSARPHASSRPATSGAAEGRRAGYTELVTDPHRGGNALFFPIEAEERNGYGALEPDGTVVCLAFTAYDFR